MHEYELPLMPEPARAAGEAEAILNSTEMFMMNPLTVTVDVNELFVSGRSEEEVFELLGKLKDLLS